MQAAIRKGNLMGGINVGYRICSLNVRKSIRSDDKDRDFYAFLNNLIADEGIDIFAFQEAKDIYFIRGVRRNLPRYWDGDSVPNSELAFVWNTNRVAECSKTQMPQVFESYKADKHMYREPVCARFVPVDFKLNFEIRLVNVHIVHHLKDSPNPVKDRKAECSLVKGVIYETVDKPPTGKDGSFRSVFTVVLGDYNLNCDACNQCGPANIRTYQEELTTLKSGSPGYSSSYDHFSYRADSTVPRNTPRRIDAVDHYFNGDFKGYRDNVSDHVPVKLELL